MEGEIASGAIEIFFILWFLPLESYEYNSSSFLIWNFVLKFLTLIWFRKVQGQGQGQL